MMLQSLIILTILWEKSIKAKYQLLSPLAKFCLVLHLILILLIVTLLLAVSQLLMHQWDTEDGNSQRINQNGLISSLMLNLRVKLYFYQVILTSGLLQFLIIAEQVRMIKALHLKRGIKLLVQRILIIL